MLVSAMTYSDAAALMGGAGALLAALWAVAIFVAAKICRKRTDEIITATTGAIQKFIGQQMQNVIANRDPKSYYTLDILFPNGESLRTPMIPGVSVTSLENIDITITSHNAKETIGTLVCKGFGHITSHAHAHHHETIFVLAGVMTCVDTGKIYRQGDTWEVPPGTFHSATFQDCVLILRYHPPLFTAHERPVDLSAMPNVFPVN